MPGLANAAVSELLSRTAAPQQPVLQALLTEGTASDPQRRSRLLAGLLVGPGAAATGRPVVARRPDPALPATPERLYEDIGPLSTAWVRTHPSVERARKALADQVAQLQAAAPEDRAALFDGGVLRAEQTLQAALRTHLDSVVPAFQRLQQEGGPRAATGGLATMLQPYADEIERSRREHDALQRVFSIRVAESIEEKYRAEVKPIPGGGCMTAMYKGFEVLFSPDDVKVLRKQVYRDAKKVLDKTGRDTNNVDRIMETLRRTGRAGAARTSRYDRRTKAWVPSVEDAVFDMVVESIPGWFFFGLSVSGAYHTVTLAVDTTGPSAKLYWLDQFTRGFTKEVTGRLNDKMQEKWLRPSYGYAPVKVWPIIPQPATAVQANP